MNYGPRIPVTWSSTARPPAGRLSTSRTELIHIGIAFAVLTVDLVLLLSGAGAVLGYGVAALESVSVALVVTAAASALTGFVAHELAHKVAAQRMGYWAEFRMAPMGLLISLVTAALGFLWALPGATVVGGIGEEDRGHWGRTSLAGPLTNLVLGAGFYAGTLLAFRTNSDLYPWLVVLTWVNGWFALFNLLPFGPLDGAKVLRWNRLVWLGAIALVGAFAGVATLLLYGYLNPLLQWT